MRCKSDQELLNVTLIMTPVMNPKCDYDKIANVVVRIFEMRNFLFSLFFIGLSCFSFTVKADVLVLIHGYLASAESWEVSGINNILNANGWKRGGLITSMPASSQFYQAPGKDAENKVYVVDLPADAPIVIQTDQFLAMMQTIQQLHPDEPVILLGHSAGGVVARMALIRGNLQNVKTLITIASPHIGTTRANEALSATDESGMFGFAKSFFGGRGYDTLRQSRGLLFDLAHPAPGSLLYWLNAQQHPDINYISVVRLNRVGFAGDELVPGYSQDMNNVPSIHGSSHTVMTPAGHTLVTQDGSTIVEILNGLNESDTDDTESVS